MQQGRIRLILPATSLPRLVKETQLTPTTVFQPWIELIGDRTKPPIGISPPSLPQQLPLFPRSPLIELMCPVYSQTLSR